MVDLGTYQFKNLELVEITHEEYFTNAYIEEVFESENMCTSTKLLCIILDAKYE